MRVAIVGAGRRGIVHGRAAASFPDTDVVAVVDPDAARGEALANELGGRAFASHLEAFAETQPDAVVLCSPPPLHVDQALDAIGFGATLLIEKPVALDLASVARLGTAARDADRLVLVCQQLRYADGALRAKQALEGRRVALAQLRMIATPSFGDVVEQGRKVKEPALFESGHEARTKWIFVGEFRHGKTPQVAHDLQDVLVHGVDVE